MTDSPDPCDIGDAGNKVGAGSGVGVVCYRGRNNRCPTKTSASVATSMTRSAPEARENWIAAASCKVILISLPRCRHALRGMHRLLPGQDLLFPHGPKTGASRATGNSGPLFQTGCQGSSVGSQSAGERAHVCQAASPGAIATAPICRPGARSDMLSTSRSAAEAPISSARTRKQRHS